MTISFEASKRNKSPLVARTSILLRRHISMLCYFLCLRLTTDALANRCFSVETAPNRKTPEIDQNRGVPHKVQKAVILANFLTPPKISGPLRQKVFEKK